MLLRILGVFPGTHFLDTTRDINRQKPPTQESTLQDSISYLSERHRSILPTFIAEIDSKTQILS